MLDNGSLRSWSPGSTPDPFANLAFLRELTVPAVTEDVGSSGRDRRGVTYVSAVSWSSPMSDRFRTFGVLLVALLVASLPAATERSFRFGKDVRLHDLHRVSDGGIIAVGWAADLDWVPPGTTLRSLSPTGIRSRDTAGQAIVLRLSPGLDTLQWVASFPRGSVGPLRRIRSSGANGALLDSLFLSGDRTVADPLDDGYFLASLAGGASPNAVPSVAWTFDVACPPRRAGGRQGTSQYKLVQAWDVDPKSSVWVARGAEADFDSAEVVRLDARGRLTLVEEWESHVTTSGKVWRGRPSLFTGTAGKQDTLRYSRLFLKSTDAQAPRSRQRVVVSGGTKTVLDVDRSQMWFENGVGELQRGAKPLDVLFPGPCQEFYPSASDLFADSVRCPTGKGWTGASASSRATARIGGLIVERESMRWALALTWNGLAADGSPLDIPTVMAFDSEGKSLWWSRLRSDAASDSGSLDVATSLSEITAMGVGLNPSTTGPILLVNARARRSEAFWSPELASKGAGWRGSLVGLPSQGQEAAWLGVMTLVDGELLASTWIADPSAGSGGVPLGDHFFRGWPRPGSSGEVLGSTRCSRVSLDAKGRILITCHGERPLTTPGVSRSVPTPGQVGPSGWNVLTLWNASLQSPEWAAAVDGIRTTGDSGAGMEVDAHLLLPDGGVVVVGRPARQTFRLPTISAPAWASDDGDVVVQVVALPSQVGIDGKVSRRSSPVLRGIPGGVRVQGLSGLSGSCQWFDASGRSGPSVAIQAGEAVVRLPPGRGLLWILIRTEEGRWVLALPRLG